MSARSARAFQYPTGSRSRATRSPSGSSAGTAFAISAQTRVAPMTTDSIEAASRAPNRRPTAASITPSPRNAQYATALLKASQLRSPAIDHHIVTPIQMVSATAAPTTSAPERPTRGVGIRARATHSSDAANAMTAAPPTGRIPPTSEASPANIAPRRIAPTRAANARTPKPDARMDGSDADSMAGHASNPCGLPGGARSGLPVATRATAKLAPSGMSRAGSRVTPRRV